MKICTGEQYEGQYQQLAGIKDWHGRFGHINVLKLDHKSSCTGYGAHERVVAFCPSGNDLTCRVDHVWGLPMPTYKQVLKAAKARNGNDMRGKWYLSGIETHENGKSTDFNFVRI